MVRRLAVALSCAALALLALSLFAHTIIDIDIWWHLRTGEHIIDTGSIPGYDIYSYTAGGSRWIDTHWLFQTILYVTHSALGSYGLSSLFILVYSTVFAFLWFSCPPGKSKFAAVLLFWLGIMASSARFYSRPEVFTYLMISIFTFILFGFEGGRRPARSLIALIPLQAVWANMQGLFILGPFLVFAYAAQPIATVALQRLRNREPDPDLSARALSLAGLFAGCVVACLITPHGIEGLLFPFTLFTRVGGFENVFARSIAEFQPPFSGYNLTLPLKYFAVFLAVSAGLLAADYRNLKLSHAIVFAGLGYLALNARRNVAIFVLAMLPIAVDHANNIISRLREARGGRFSRAIGVVELVGHLVIPLVIALQVFGIVSGRHYAADKRVERFGLGFKQQTFPHGAFAFVKEKKIGGPFFNNMDIGGLFIWEMYPDEKVFIDPRLEVNTAEALAEYRRAMSDPAAFSRLADKYALNAVIVSHTSQDGLGLVPILYMMPEWALVYLDPLAAVFVRNAPRNADLIARNGIDIDRDRIEPIAPNDTLNEGGALALGRILGEPRLFSEDVEAQSRFNLGLLFLVMGRFERAIEHLGGGLELMPESAEGHYNIGIAYERMGKSEAALDHYRKAISADSRHMGSHTNLGRIYEERGLGKKAEEHYRLAIKSGGRNTIPLFNLGALYYERGDRERARQHWEKALKADPSFEPARQALEKL